MEVRYTNFELDPKIYGKNELCGVLDKDGNFINNTIYDIRRVTFKGYLPVKWFLKLGIPKKNKELINIIIGELELRKELLNRKISTLSESELLKVLLTKLLISDVKTIILSTLDSALTWNDINQVLKISKKYIKETNKTLIFEANKIDYIVNHADRFIITEDDNIIYNGKDFSQLPVLTETSEFAELANKKGAKLHKYKEPNDLLKAIYRSVKK